MRKCDSCGKVYSEGKDVFCPHCGAIASENCTHSSSFDAGRYDRGEIYRQNAKETYKQGIDPHIQRENKTDNDIKDIVFDPQDRFPDKNPLKNILRYVRKYAPKGKNYGKIAAIIIFIIGAFNYANGNIDLSDLVEDYNESTAYEDYAFIDATADSATIEIDPENFGNKINLIIDNIYLPEEYASSESAVYDCVTQKNYSGDLCLFSLYSDSLPYQDYVDNWVEAGYTSVSLDDTHPGKFGLEYEYREGEIICVSEFMIYIDSATSLKIELPFAAFSCDKEGNVTYYQKLSYDDTVEFEKLEDTKIEPEHYGCVIELKNEE